MFKTGNLIWTALVVSQVYTNHAGVFGPIEILKARCLREIRDKISSLREQYGCRYTLNPMIDWLHG